MLLDIDKYKNQRYYKLYNYIKRLLVTDKNKNQRSYKLYN